MFSLDLSVYTVGLIILSNRWVLYFVFCKMVNERKQHKASILTIIQFLLKLTLNNVGIVWYIKGTMYKEFVSANPRKPVYGGRVSDHFYITENLSVPIRP